MATTDIREVVAAPTRTPYRYGLFSVLDFDTTGRAGIEMAWDSTGCAGLFDQLDECLNAAGAAVDKNAQAEIVGCGNDGGVIAFTLIGYDKSSLGRDRQFPNVERARQHLLLQEQYAVEERLTDAIGAVAADVSSPAPTGSGQDLVFAFAVGAVDEALAALGGEGVVMVPRSMVSIIPETFMQTGSVLRLKTGTPVVAYGGVGASLGGAPVVLGASALLARRGTVEVSDAPDTAVNSHTAWAERAYSLGWECQPVAATPAVTA